MTSWGTFVQSVHKPQYITFLQPAESLATVLKYVYSAFIAPLYVYRTGRWFPLRRSDETPRLTIWMLLASNSTGQANFHGLPQIFFDRALLTGYLFFCIFCFILVCYFRIIACRIWYCLFVWMY